MPSLAARKPSLIFGNLLIDQHGRQVHLNEAPVHLTATEYALLATLAGQPGRAFSSVELLRVISDSDWLSDTRLFQVHASRLRNKLGESGAEPHFIHTIHGYGYRFQDGSGRRAESPRKSETHVLLNLARTIEYISPHVRHILGYQPQQLIGVNLYDLLHPDYIPKALAFRSALDGGQETQFVMPFRNADGHYILIAADIFPIAGRDGSAVAHMAIWRSHEPLSAAPSRLHPAGQDDQPEVFHLVYNADFTLVQLIPETAFLGWPARQLIGTHFTPNGLSVTAMRHVAESLLQSGQTSVEGHITAKTADGDAVELPMATQFLTDDSGRLSGMHCTVLTRTARRTPTQRLASTEPR